METSLNFFIVAADFPVFKLSGIWWSAHRKARKADRQTHKGQLYHAETTIKGRKVGVLRDKKIDARKTEREKKNRPTDTQRSIREASRFDALRTEFLGDGLPVAFIHASDLFHKFRSCLFQTAKQVIE